MKNKLYLFIAMISVLQVLSCKKDAATQTQPAQQIHSLETGLLTFSINGELLSADIDTIHNTIVITVPDTLNQHNLTAAFTSANQVNATINNTAVNNTFVYDFSKTVNFTVTSADKKSSTTFKVTVQRELNYFGLSGNVIASKSLNRDYGFYFDQFDGSIFQTLNCGPTVSTMAIKWADSTFTGTPAYARTQREPQGGWWTTTDVQAYLGVNGISSVADTIANLDTLVKTSINNNNVVILCLDMYYVPYNTIDYQHINKFYNTNAVGWGHFLLVKGYLQFDNTTFYLEIYDPYSEGQIYTTLDVGQLKGKDRYYLSDGIELATSNWWPYAIIAGIKGQKVVTSKLSKTLSFRKSIPVAYGR